MIVKKLPLTQVQASVQASAQSTSDDQTLKGLTSLGVAIEQLPLLGMRSRRLAPTRRAALPLGYAPQLPMKWTSSLMLG
jgi:hypothetical protein